MKRILLLSLLSVFGALALQAEDPWAEMEEVGEIREEQLQVENPSQKSLLPKILRGEALEIQVWVPSDSNNGQKEETSVEELVHEAYNLWFGEAAGYVKHQKREEEFKDVLPILEREIQTQIIINKKSLEELKEDISNAKEQGDFRTLFKGGEDVVLFLDMDDETMKTVSSRGTEDLAGSSRTFPEDETALVFVSKYEEKPDQVDEMGPELAEYLYTLGVTMHEFGHTLGMADAYEEGYKRNASKVRRSKKRTNACVMEDCFLIHLDDADGIINLIDTWNIYELRRQYKNDWCAHLSSRVKNGWNSLRKSEEDESKSTDRFMLGTSVSLVSKLPPEQRCAMRKRRGNNNGRRGRGKGKAHRS